MIIHNIDIFIIKCIYEAYFKKERIDTGRIARKWYSDVPPFSDPRAREDFWKDKYDKVCKRLKIMSEEGLVFINKQNGKNEYILILDNVSVKKIRLPDGNASKIIFLKEKDRKWKAYQL